MKVKEQTKAYADHEEIIDFMKTALSGNLEGVECMHAREILDDVIHDLVGYRDTLATCDEYLKAGKL
jgi:hypothetical protein